MRRIRHRISTFSHRTSRIAPHAVDMPSTKAATPRRARAVRRFRPRPRGELSYPYELRLAATILKSKPMNNHCSATAVHSRTKDEHDQNESTSKARLQEDRAGGRLEKAVGARAAKDERKAHDAEPVSKGGGKAQREESGAPLPEFGGQHARGFRKQEVMTGVDERRAVATKNPAGGLTAAGRAELGRTEGANLKAGVTKPEAEMSHDEMRRKGSWAARFYGRAVLPPLVKPNGEPTRFALSAHAWGEAVPKTETQARDIAEKGRKLLKRYRESTAKS